LIPASKTSVAALAELHAPYSVVERISDFSVRIDQAAMLLSAAFMEANVTDFFRSKSPRTSKQAAVPAQWYSQIVETSLQRATEVRNALVHGWTPTGRAEHLAADAFRVLSSLSPAANELMRLYGIDRTGAFLQLAKQLEAIALQFELSADLLAEVEAKDGSRSSDERRFAELRGALLESAKGGLSLTDAAELLGVSRQAVHKRIKNGSVLGIMDGPTLVLPRAQFVDRNGKLEVVSGLPELLKLFGSAGEWSALQFLVGPDPNLAGKKPLDVLADGRVEDVLAAARAYLDIDGS
jgi:DNA-directed RNA polymerase specialized sigma24 family protein